MKKILLSFIILLSYYSHCQVGIGTAQPESTFDIKAGQETGTSLNVDGLLIPRVDSERALSMDNIATSTLIYVDDIKPNTAIGKAVNVNKPGFYYFNGSQWAKLSTATNIYTSDESLSSDRIVSQDTKSLSFTSTATSGTSHFSVDGTTLNVDAVGNRVGIGTSTPQNALHVNGVLQISGPLNVGGDSNTVGVNGLEGQALSSRGSGLPPEWVTSVSAKYTVSGDFSKTNDAIFSSGSTGYVDTKVSIKLSKGKWLVNAGIVFKNENSTPLRFWQSVYLSSSSTTVSLSGFEHLGPAGENSAYTKEIIRLGYGTSPNGDLYTLLSGSNFIEVTADEVTLYLLAQNRPVGYWNVRGKAWENYFYAIPVN